MKFCTRRLRENVREAAASRALLLVVDDLHWADPGSRRLLAAIRGALAILPVVVLCTYRDTEPAADALYGEVGPERHLVLGGLAPGELAAAVRMATGSAVPDTLLEGLHARTAGNPYFAAESVRLLRAEGQLDASAQLPAELLPPTVRAVLERRLARLPTADAELLRVAALLGAELDPPLLAEVAGEPLAVVASALAAADAVRRAGYEDAVRLMSAALALTGPDSDRGELLCALGEAALAAGDPSRARAAYAEATGLARRTGRAELLAAAALGRAGGQDGFEMDLRDPDRVAVLTEALQAQREAAGTASGSTSRPPAAGRSTPSSTGTHGLSWLSTIR